jgi:hypothetical protein
MISLVKIILQAIFCSQACLPAGRVSEDKWFFWKLDSSQKTYDCSFTIQRKQNKGSGFVNKRGGICMFLCVIKVTG